MNDMILKTNSRSMPPLNIPYSKGCDYGMGVDLLTGSYLAKGVQDYTVGGVPRMDGQRSSTSYHVINSASELIKKLDIELNGHGGTAAFSARFNYKRSLYRSVNQQSTYILAHSVVTNSFQQFSDGKLNAHALTLLNEGKIDEFRRRYGDMYVRGIESGGEFYALITVSTENISEQRTVAGKIQAKLSLGGGDISVSELEKYTSSRLEIKINTVQSSGIGDQHGFIDSDFNELKKRLKEFPTSAHQHPVPLFVQIAPYPILENYPSGNSLLQNINGQHNALLGYESALLDYESLRNEIDLVREHPEYFIGVPDSAMLEQWRNTVSQRIEELENTMNKCIDEHVCPTFNFTIPPEIALPIRTSSEPEGEESKKLGHIWQMTEVVNWKGTWVRQGQSRTFNSRWKNIAGHHGDITGTLRIYIAGNTVVVHRTTDGYNTRYIYKGTLNGTKVTGTFARSDGGEGSGNWDATII